MKVELELTGLLKAFDDDPITEVFNQLFAEANYSGLLEALRYYGNESGTFKEVTYDATTDYVIEQMEKICGEEAILKAARGRFWVIPDGEDTGDVGRVECVLCMARDGYDDAEAYRILADALESKMKENTTMVNPVGSDATKTPSDASTVSAASLDDGRDGASDFIPTSGRGCYPH